MEGEVRPSESEEIFVNTCSHRNRLRAYSPGRMPTRYLPHPGGQQWWRYCKNESSIQLVKLRNECELGGYSVKIVVTQAPEVTSDRRDVIWLGGVSNCVVLIEQDALLSKRYERGLSSLLPQHAIRDLDCSQCYLRWRSPCFRARSV